MFGEQVSKIILGVLEPHPKFLFRQTYDVADLAESIRKVGQLQPGRVVPRPDGKGYWVYIGMRRYFALKLLFDQAKTEEEKKNFLNFKAFIDEATEEEMAIRALHENEGDKEERIRMELTPLEKVIILKSFEIKNVALGKHYEKLRNIPLSIEQMKNLQKIEKETGYQFEPHVLEYLGEIARNDDELYLTAASIAKNEFKSKDKMEIAYETRGEATGWDWFKKLFPTITVHDTFFDQLSQLRDQVLGGQHEGVNETAAGESKGNAKEESAGHTPPPTQGEGSAPQPPPQPENEHKGKPHSIPLYTVQDALVVRCPYCNTPHVVELEAVNVSSKIHEPSGSSATPVPNPIDMVQIAGVSPAILCSSCRKSYYFTIKKEEQKFYALSSKKAVKLLQEAEPAEPIPVMSWDADEQCWVVYDTEGAVLKKIEVGHNNK